VRGRGRKPGKTGQGQHLLSVRTAFLCPHLSVPLLALPTDCQGGQGIVEVNRKKKTQIIICIGGKTVTIGASFSRCA